MSELDNVFLAFAVKAEAENPPQKGDFTGEDGLLYCGRCKAPKQCRPFPSQPETVVFCVCDCFKREEAEREREKRRQTMERMREWCFKTPDRVDADGNRKYDMKAEYYARFGADDSPESEPAKVARAYAANFTEGGDWLLFCGSNGIGKSFYAACICNDLIDRGYTCKFTSISEIEHALWASKDKQALYNGLAYYDLIVIDDFGAERETEYMTEIQFNVFQTLLQIGKPCIITTNFTAQEIMNPQSKDMRRILSRIYQKSIPLTCTGKDRRRESIMQGAKERVRKLLASVPESSESNGGVESDA